MMKMTTRVAYQNMKFYKSRNILIGIAIVLTTLLLFVIPSVGKGMVDLQYEAVNQTYPSWHALYRGVDENKIEQLALRHDILRYGLRSDAGQMSLENAKVTMLYLDQIGAELYKMPLKAGKLPEAENEIVVSNGILDAFGQSGKIGDTLTVPYQIWRDGELDFSKTKEFRICGLLEDSEAGREQKTFTALISREFLLREFSESGAAQPIEYRFLFQIKDTKNATTIGMEEKIYEIADQFDIAKKDVNVNEDYLGANYVDPSLFPIIACIMAIIMLAGVITIYSIYYVSMNQKIQEFGRLKALGATKRQVKQIILREGMCVACIAIPIGLLIGTFTVGAVMKMFYRFSTNDSAYMESVKMLLEKGEMTFCYWWAYALAAAVGLCTVYVSLLRPMRMAAKISEIEAMRAQGAGAKLKSSKKGYAYLNLFRLTCRNLTENKKKSLITILSMSATGIFLMVVATVLACANPKESANASIVGSYELSPVVEDGNKEHPERKWSEIQKDNPLSDALKRQVEGLPGVKRVDVFSNVRVNGGPFGEEDIQEINGVPKEYKEELEDGIESGNVTYEELKSGDKVIADKALLHWYPQLAVGDKLTLTVHDGDRSYEKEFEIAAFGSYTYGFTNYAYLIMAKEAADKLCQNSSDTYFHVIADRRYDETLISALNEIVSDSGRLMLRSWKEEYDHWKKTLAATSGACYIFIGILGVISVMNLVNTMINSVHVRKRELGILQAIGMSDIQLMKMLQMEGLFYTVCTLFLTVGAGSLIGYPVFLYAKANQLFAITDYHYPAVAAVAVSLLLVAIQGILAVCIGKSVRRESLIERVRFQG